MKRVLIAGCGYVGCRLAELLLGAGSPAEAEPLPGNGGTAAGWKVFGLKRDPSTLPAGVEHVPADVSEPATLHGLPASLDAIIYAVSPSGRSEAEYRTAYVDGLRNVLKAADRSAGGRSGDGDRGGDGGGPAPRVILVSSTGVYGQRDGRWVDEETDPEPADATGRVLLEGERVARAAEGAGVVLRLGGIYGPGRDRTVRRVLSGEAECPDADRFGNRIHRDDAAGALRHLLTIDDPEPVYIGVDRDPAPLRDVYRWIAARGDAPDPCRSGGAPTAGVGGRRASSKRCSSRRLVESGFEFLYPSFREGYGPIVDALTGEPAQSPGTAPPS